MKPDGTWDDGVDYVAYSFMCEWVEVNHYVLGNVGSKIYKNDLPLYLDYALRKGKNSKNPFKKFTGNDYINNQLLQVKFLPIVSDPTSKTVLSGEFIFVDGKVNVDETKNYERLSYVPYSRLFEWQVYDEPSKEDKIIDRISVTYKGSAGVHGCLKENGKAIPVNILDFAVIALANGATILLDSRVMEDKGRIYNPDRDSFIEYNLTNECYKRFLIGSGGEYKGIRNMATRHYIDGSMVVRDKLKANSGYNYFVTNMNKTMRQVEAFLNENNTSAYIASSREAHWTGCSYGTGFDNLGEFIDISHNIISLGIFNKANAGITANITYDKDTRYYTMEYRYYLVVFYDFSFGSMVEALDAYGIAKSYELFGVVKGKITWRRGELYNANKEI